MADRLTLALRSITDTPGKANPSEADYLVSGNGRRGTVRLDQIGRSLRSGGKEMRHAIDQTSDDAAAAMAFCLSAWLGTFAVGWPCRLRQAARSRHSRRQDAHHRRGSARASSSASTNRSSSICRADAYDILVANPAVADAVTRTARRIYLFGKSVGQTNIFVFGPNGEQIVSLDLAVERDVAGLEDYLKRFIPSIRHQRRIAQRQRRADRNGAIRRSTPSARPTWRRSS